MSSRRELALAAMATIARALEGQEPFAVFVGGIVPAVYPLEEGVDVRATQDVDCVVDLRSTAEYYAYVEALRSRGFRTCTDEGAPLCRLVYDEIRVDFVATHDTGVGPTNPWYAEAVARASMYSVAPGVEVRVIRPIYFVATKLEAFRGRGRGDYEASHDLEDLLAVLAGLPALREAIGASDSGVGREVRAELVALCGDERFIDGVPGHFEGDAAGQRRADAILRWLRSLA